MVDVWKAGVVQLTSLLGSNSLAFRDGSGNDIVKGTASGSDVLDFTTNGGVRLCPCIVCGSVDSSECTLLDRALTDNF